MAENSCYDKQLLVPGKLILSLSLHLEFRVGMSPPPKSTISNSSSIGIPIYFPPPSMGESVQLSNVEHLRGSEIGRAKALKVGPLAASRSSLNQIGSYFSQWGSLLMGEFFFADARRRLIESAALPEPITAPPGR